MTYFLYQGLRQNAPDWQLRGRFETLGVRFYIIEVKRGTYLRLAVLASEQQLEPAGPGGKIHIN